ncbi:MAG: hypothetical protein QM530_01700 [Phycisphaerales bacterium]|nr:hypothetical protein [Phycisphaerales bacterium]
MNYPKKYQYLLSFTFVLVVSCSNSSIRSKNCIRKEIKTILVGADEDTHGCKGSAGYTWGLIRKECIRSFELPLQLTNKNNSFSAGVAFASDSSSVEIFTKDGTMLLNKQGDAMYSDTTWIFQRIQDEWLMRKSDSKEIAYSSKKK